MKKFGLHWQILIGIVLGILFGMFLKDSVPYLSIVGKIFIRGLKMIVVPLIFSSLVTGVTNIQNNQSLGRIGLKALIYYLSTSIIAILLGLVLVNGIKPGIGTNINFNEDFQQNLEANNIKDTLIHIVPDNIFNSLSQGDMLSIIFFSIILGIFINRLEKDKRNLLSGIFDAFFDVMMKITLFVIRFAPIGIMGIIAEVISEQEDFYEFMLPLLKFAVTVIFGLFIHLVVTLPLILYFVGRVNPLKHFKAMLTVILTAFTTASSNATLPLTMETIEEKSGVSNKVASFTLPLGATINMDGTALYELVVAGFVAQILGIDLTFGQQFILVSTALLASIGTAGIPMASYVTMSIIFTAIDLPIYMMFIVMPLDRPLDMLRTAVNVYSDSCGAVVISKSEKEILNY